MRGFSAQTLLALGLGGAVSGAGVPAAGCLSSSPLGPARSRPLFLPTSADNQKCLRALPRPLGGGPGPSGELLGQSHVQNPQYEENYKVDTVIESRISTLLCDLGFHY